MWDPVTPAVAMSSIVPETVSAGDAVRSHADVVVIGGGIIGELIAYFLAERGVSVVLCEKGLIGAEQSARNWGWACQMGRDVAQSPLAIQRPAAVAAFPTSASAPENGFRADRHHLSLRHKARDELPEPVCRMRIALGSSSRLVQARELGISLPGIAGNFVGGLHTATDGGAEPTMANPAALARAAIERGAHLVQNCAVMGVEQQSGVISGVVTERGTIKCSSVVVAGGAWSRLFLGNVGVDFPQLKIQGTVAHVGPVAGVPQMPVGGKNFSFRQRLDGGYTIAMRNANVAPIVPDSFRLFVAFVPTLIRQWHESRA